MRSLAKALPCYQDFCGRRLPYKPTSTSCVLFPNARSVAHCRQHSVATGTNPLRNFSFYLYPVNHHPCSKKAYLVFEFTLLSVKKLNLSNTILLIFDQIALFSLFLCYFANCMKKYRIQVTEILSRIVETESESERDAVEKVRQMYRNCGIILDASDYIKTEISAER